MSKPFKAVRQRIRNELPEIKRAIDRAQQALHRAKQTADDFYLDSAALNLHGFYSGIERIFEIIAVHVDGQLPQGQNWHQVLLQQMSQESEGQRPAVISDSVREQLDAYRGFRHVVRNVYTYTFDAFRVEKLMDGADAFYDQLEAELLAFADFLEANEE